MRVLGRLVFEKKGKLGFFVCFFWREEGGERGMEGERWFVCFFEVKLFGKEGERGVVGRRGLGFRGFGVWGSGAFAVLGLWEVGLGHWEGAGLGFRGLGGLWFRVCGSGLRAQFEGFFVDLKYTTFSDTRKSAFLDSRRSAFLDIRASSIVDTRITHFLTHA